jgi:hypothetical protein
VFYVVESTPIDLIISELSKIGCEDTDEVEALFSNDAENKGYTHSNLSRRKSIIVIGPTTCPAQFAHSYDHEKHHLAIHIAKEDNIDPFGEELAYLVGEIGFNMFQVAKKFLCEHCREEIE